jgi:hypothetical protein
MMAALEKVAGAGTVRDIGRAFDLMEITERLIKRAGGKPGNRAWEAFKLLSPGRLIEFSDELYEAHCREVIDNLMTGKDTRPGTDAEVAVLLHDLSLKAPLNASYLRAYEDAMIRMEMKLPHGFDEARGQYAWKTEGDEILAELRWKTRREERVIG